MNAYAIYAGKRLLQFALVVFIGINLAFVITHSTPIDPVEQTIATATSFGSTSPQAVEMMRQSLRELYGLEGSVWSQYAVFWKRIVVALEKLGIPQSRIDHLLAQDNPALVAEVVKELEGQS